MGGSCRLVGNMGIKEDALQTILLAATGTHAKFMFRKLLCGCRSLGFASKLCALDTFEGCTAGGVKLGQ